MGIGDWVDSSEYSAGHSRAEPHRKTAIEPAGVDEQD